MFFVSHSTVYRKLMQSRPKQSKTFGCFRKTAKQSPGHPHFSYSHPLPPHSKAGISCWWPSANAPSLTENLLWRWARETEEGENFRIEMRVMMMPSGKIWKVYTADTLFYLPMPEKQTTSKITHKHQWKIQKCNWRNEEWIGYKKGLIIQNMGQEDNVWLHLSALDRITQNSKVETVFVFAWTVSSTEVVEENLSRSSLWSY